MLSLWDPDPNRYNPPQEQHTGDYRNPTIISFAKNYGRDTAYLIDSNDIGNESVILVCF
jgi:hypothetical protein